MASSGYPQVRYDLIRMAGGLDLVTPTLSLPPGVARDALNFEASITGGYTRIAGYERFDGRPNPSDALYTIITVNLSATVNVGDTITGVTSGATGYVISTSTNQLVFTFATSAFVAGESLQVSAVTKGTFTAFGPAGTTTSKQAAEYLNLAADAYRANITTVPGSGSIRGVVYYNDVVYAWRNNSAGTAMAIYKSTLLPRLKGWYKAQAFGLATPQQATCILHLLAVLLPRAKTFVLAAPPTPT